jgi:glucose 1-dehydrogenase
MCLPAFRTLKTARARVTLAPEQRQEYRPMKAVAVFPDRKEVGFVDQPPPTISRPDEVKVRIFEVGVCGTDREICCFDYGSPPQGSQHLVLGHEGLGEVVEVGAAVRHLKPGDLVVPMVRRPCTHDSCTACRSDRSDFCYTGDFTERGIKLYHGFMTEYIVDQEKYLCRVPPELRDVAVLMEPLTVAEKALAQIWQVQQRLPWACPAIPGKAPGHCHRAVVLGAGPIGILGAMAMKVAGFDTVVYSRSKKPNQKAAVVESFGVPYISAEDCSPEELAQTLGNIDVVYEAVGAARISFDVLKVLGMNGIFVFTGIPGFKPPIDVDADLIMRNVVLKNQVVLGTVNAGRETFEAAIKDLGIFMQRWPDSVRAIITGQYPIEQARELLLGKARGIKNVLKLNGHV